jgi:uncharacterized membrane protein YccF (DUF307 family)
MKVVGNIIWLLFGGIVFAAEYFIVSILLMITIVGFPFGLQTLKLARLVLWPFGVEVVPKPANGCLNIGMTILWLLCGGLDLCLKHLLLGLLFYITIVGIPFAKQHFKLAEIALTPFHYYVSKKEKERD